MVQVAEIAERLCSFPGIERTGRCRVLDHLWKNDPGYRYVADAHYGRVNPVRNAGFALLCASAVGLLTTDFGVAQTRGDPAHGRGMAEQWCSACHLVSPTQKQANVDVPTFASIARRLPGEADVLAGFIANPHPPMPNLNLSRQDIQDLLAYIATLK